MDKLHAVVVIAAVAIGIIDCHTLVAEVDYVTSIVQIPL